MVARVIHFTTLLNLTITTTIRLQFRYNEYYVLLPSRPSKKLNATTDTNIKICTRVKMAEPAESAAST